MKNLPKVQFVPFSPKGDMLERGQAGNSGVEMRSNQPFPDKMTFQEIFIGYNGKPKLRWKDQKDNEFTMLFSDLAEILPFGIEPGGKVDGLWMIRKAGPVHGLICISNGYKL